MIFHESFGRQKINSSDNARNALKTSFEKSTSGKISLNFLSSSLQFGLFCARICLEDALGEFMDFFTESKILCGGTYGPPRGKKLNKPEHLFRHEKLKMFTMCAVFTFFIFIISLNPPCSNKHMGARKGARNKVVRAWGFFQIWCSGLLNYKLVINIR